jgi:hypothetical protein
MKEITCALCLAAHPAKEGSSDATVLFHAVQDMPLASKATLVICADSPVKPPGWQVAPNGK